MLRNVITSAVASSQSVHRSSMENRIKIQTIDQINDIGFELKTLIDNRTGERAVDIESKIYMLAEKTNWILWYLKAKEK